MTRTSFGWGAILRIGLAQAALGATLVLTTSTLNRVMVVELALPASVPGLLVALHHAFQLLRPRWGYGSDRGGRRTPWIVGGMAVLALGGTLAAVATAVMAVHLAAGLALGVLAVSRVGIGVGAAGTSVRALLSEGVDEARRAPAATIVWVTMIAGFIVSAAIAGRLLDPFSPARLVAVSALVGAGAVALACLAVRGLEARILPVAAPTPRAAAADFRATLALVWADRTARDFTIFIFASMLAYSAQDLILEPYGGLAFAMTPGETTRLGGLQNTGTLLGLAIVGLLGVRGRGGSARLRATMVAGCVASALALALVSAAASTGTPELLKMVVFGLGFSNGVFAAAAIASMMALARSGPAGSHGTRMGVWGAAQALAFGFGGLAGTLAVDGVRLATGLDVAAYQAVFAGEALLFLLAAAMAASLGRRPAVAISVREEPA